MADAVTVTAPTVTRLQTLRSTGFSTVQLSSGRTSSAAEAGAREEIQNILNVLDQGAAAIRDHPCSPCSPDIPADPVGQAEAPSEDIAAKAEKQLQESISELLSTEANYLEDLRFTTREYSRPLFHLLDDSQAHYNIFSNHEQLLELHVKLDNALARARACTNQLARAEMAIQAFLNLLPYFKMYAHYCANYPHVAAALSQVLAEEKVGKLLVDKHATHHTTLQALLFRPVQRMCLYPLLFKRILSSTSEGLQLHQLCEQAFYGVQQLNGEVNENVRNMESRLHMMEVLTQEVKSNDIQHLFEAPRSLVSEAFVDMKCHAAAISRSEWRIRRQYKWYVFTDYLLVCRPDKISAGWHKKELWPLSEVRVSTNNPQWRRSSDAEQSEVTRADSNASRSISSSRNNSYETRTVSVGSAASCASTKGGDTQLPCAPAAGGDTLPIGASTSGSTALPICDAVPHRVATEERSDAPRTPRGGQRLTKVATLVGFRSSTPRSTSIDDTGEGSIADGERSEGSQEKPEVLHLHVGGAKYKCWAQSEGEMLGLVSTICSLRTTLKARQEDLEKRRATCA